MGKRVELPSMAMVLAQGLDRRIPPPYDEIDAGIRDRVKLLWDYGIETCQSCQGGESHCYPEPTIQFLGGPSQGPLALSIAMQHGLRVSELRRVWAMQDGEPTGPTWEITFVFDDHPVWWRPRWSKTVAGRKTASRRK